MIYFVLHKMALLNGDYPKRKLRLAVEVGPENTEIGGIVYDR